MTTIKPFAIVPVLELPQGARPICVGFYGTPALFTVWMLLDDSKPTVSHVFAVVADGEDAPGGEGSLDTWEYVGTLRLASAEARHVFHRQSGLLTA
jgi:hypothetical protein